MKKTTSIILTACLVVNIACSNQSKEQNNSDIPILNLRNNVTISDNIFNENIRKTDYIQLETNDDCLIASVLDICLTKNYIFIVSSRQDGVLQFARDGKFIRKIAPTGMGPGETMMILSISADDKKERIYISQPTNTLYYNFSGDYLGLFERERVTSFQYYFNENITAEIGFENVPITLEGMFGMGVFNIESNDTLHIKNDFVNSDLIPAEQTVLKNVFCIEGNNGYLGYTAGNDTIFKLNKNGIKPAYILSTGNSNEAKKYLSSVESPELHFPSFFFRIFDFFETENSFYARAIYYGGDNSDQNADMLFFAYNKQTRKSTYSKGSSKPSELIGLNRRMSGLGMTANKNNLPIWPIKTYPDEKILLQVYTTPEILYLTEKDGNIILPEEINTLNEDLNPIIILYYL